MIIGRTDAKTETPILWAPHVKGWLIGKDPDAGKDWGQEEKGMTEDEMAGWHHRLNGHESEWTPGVGDGQGGLACCDSWGLKESDMTGWLNWTELALRYNFGRICNLYRLEVMAKSHECHLRTTATVCTRKFPLMVVWYKPLQRQLLTSYWTLLG